MAITGTGTQEDPFLVHSYEEIKSAASSHTGTNTKYYIKLMNDVDCNDYGVEFEWETIELANGASYASQRLYNDLDLNNHTIKNIKIKSSNYLFSGSNASADVHNGKLLNVFGAGASGFSKYIYFTNVAIGANMSGQSSGNSVFNDTTHFTSCSIYCICTTRLNRFMASHECKNSDFYLELTEGYSDRFCLTGTIDGCRFQGYVKGNGSTIGFYNTILKNSIINMEYDYGGVSGSWNELVEYKRGSVNNIENSDKTHRQSDTVGVITRVNSNQLKDSNYLTNTVGFVVVDISE